MGGLGFSLTSLGFSLTIWESRSAGLVGGAYAKLLPFMDFFILRLVYSKFIVPLPVAAVRFYTRFLVATSVAR